MDLQSIIPDQCCQKRERFRKRERRKRHFSKILGSEASGKRLLYIYIYIYIYFFFLYIYCIYIQKNMYKDKLAAEYMKTCIFVHQYR
jgi:hypothetical protein